MTGQNNIESLVHHGHELLAAGDTEAGLICWSHAAESLLHLAGQLKTNKAEVLVDQAATLIELIAECQKTNKASPATADAKSPLIEIPETGVTFDDLAGLEEPKARLYRDLIRPALNPETAKRWNRKAGGALLLYGPPGSGKTMFAKAVAGEPGVPFFELKSSTVLSKWLSESEKNVRAAFEQLREHPRCVLFIDEAEGLLNSRHNDTSAASRVVSEFLSAMDGMAGQQEGLYILAATNFPDRLDPAVKRSLRFGRPVYVGLPDSPARQQILRQQLAQVPISARLNLSVWAERLVRYSGADLVELCRQAIDHAWDREDESGRPSELIEEDLCWANQRVLPSCSEQELANYEQYQRKKDQ